MSIAAERAQLPIAVATANPGKLGRVSEAAQRVGLETLTATTPLFDEDAIKQEMDHLRDNGIAYTVGISQTKLHRQRQASMEVEGRGEDYMLVVSDSVLLDSSNRPLNRDDESAGRQAEVLADINQERQVTFAGAVSFGRKNGYGNLTVVSYCTVPLATELRSLPITIDDLPTLQDESRPIEVGYIVFGGQEGTDQTKRPLMHTASFAEARPYISGLTPDVLAMIDQTGRFEAQVGPVIEDVIASHPFNTAGFYHALEQHGGTREEFYDTFTDGWRQHLQQYGGNCSLLALETGTQLRERGLQADILLYPQNGKPEGHSALVITDPSGKEYFADPGFSMPYIIPVDSDIPLAPARISGAKSMTVIGNGTQLPTVHVLQRSGKTERLVSNGRYTLGDFERILPQVLSRLHERDAIKLDFHSQRGKRTLGFSLSTQKRQISIRTGEGMVGTYSIDDLDYQTNPLLAEQINVLALTHGLDPYQVSAQLDAARRHIG